MKRLSFGNEHGLFLTLFKVGRRPFCKLRIPRLLLLGSATVSILPAFFFILATTQAPSSQPEDVLFFEDFEDGKAQNWTLEGKWEVFRDWQGNYVLRGREHNWAAYIGDSWGDYTLKVRVKPVRGRLHINFRTSGCLRYFIGVQEDRIDLNKTQPCGTHRELRARERYFSSGRWYEIKVTGKGNKVEIFVDGWSVLAFTDPSPLLFGGIAFETLDDSEFHIDDVLVLGQRPPTYGLKWVKTGGPLGGLGYDIRMHPQNPDILYVTDSWSGVNISLDGGKTWFSSNEGITTRAGPSGDAIPVFCLTIDPHNPNVIWVGTQNARGIFKSTDGGKTWTEKTTGIVEKEGISFRGITVHPKNPNIVFAAAEISSFAWTPDRTERQGREFDLVKGVVYKTTDGGESWKAIWRGDNLARYVLINPLNPDIIYVSTGIFDREAANSDARTNNPGGVGILKSIDGGNTWRVLGTANGLKNLYIGSLFMHPINADILLAGAGNNAWRQGSGVYLSTNGGESWKYVLPTGDQPITAVEFAIANPKVAYAGGADCIYRSEDGGISWRRVTTGQIWGPPGIRAGVPIDFQVDPRNPNRIFVNNYGGGNFLSEDGGFTWTVASRGYTGAQLWDIAVDPRDSNLIYVIGRTGPFRSPDGGNSWEGLNFDPAIYAEWYAIALNPVDPRIVLISDEHTGTILRSTDGGQSWRIVFQHPGVGTDFRKRHGFCSISFSFSDPNVIYAGMRRERRNIDEGRADPSFGIYKSTDGGITWREANDSCTANQNVNVIVVDPRDENVAYAGTVKGGIFKTVDGGNVWRPINQGLQVLDIRALAIDPRDSAVIYAGAENGGVYKSTDAGKTWKSISFGMDPQAAIRAIVIDPIDTRIVYAADLRTGVYRSENGGEQWIKLNDGLRTRAVTALALSADGKILYAATEGEGVFRLDLSPLYKR